VANLRRVKGLDVLLEAAALLRRDHPGVQVAVAGDGPEREPLQRQRTALGLEGVFKLSGSVADVPAFLASIDVAVLPSRAEGMSNAVLEYMAAGRAIVATDVGGNGRLLQHGVHGLLVPPDDPAALAGAIRHWPAAWAVRPGSGRGSCSAVRRWSVASRIFTRG
jgi:glycosyltransferase involved in cell wall biosynthesis